MKRREFITLLGGTTVLSLGARAEIDFIEGQNVAIEYRWAQGHYDRLPGFAGRSRAPKGRCNRRDGR
jgi:hypothetical protein